MLASPVLLLLAWETIHFLATSTATSGSKKELPDRGLSKRLYSLANSVTISSQLYLETWCTQNWGNHKRCVYIYIFDYYYRCYFYCYFITCHYIYIMCYVYILFYIFCFFTIYYYHSIFLFYNIVVTHFFYRYSIF